MIVKTDYSDHNDGFEHVKTNRPSSNKKEIKKKKAPCCFVASNDNEI